MFVKKFSYCCTQGVYLKRFIKVIIEINQTSQKLSNSRVFDFEY